MSDLRELYQEIILDHGRDPRNHHRPEGCNHEAHGDNPLCGDRITVYLTMADGVVRDVGFEGKGCAISMASASMMTELLKGKTSAEIETLFARFHNLVAGDNDVPPIANNNNDNDNDDFDKLAVLSGVRRFPMRVKCATLAWHTLQAAMKDGDDVVSTEMED